MEKVLEKVKQEYITQVDSRKQNNVKNAHMSLAPSHPYRYVYTIF